MRGKGEREKKTHTYQNINTIHTNAQMCADIYAAVQECMNYTYVCICTYNTCVSMYTHVRIHTYEDDKTLRNMFRFFYSYLLFFYC